MKGDFAHLLVSRDIIFALFQSAKVLPFFQFIKRGSFRGETGMKKEPIQIACPFGHPFFGVQERITVKCGYCDDDPQCVNFCDVKAISFTDADSSNIAKRREFANKFADLKKQGR
jgi:hypothetical protein